MFGVIGRRAFKSGQAKKDAAATTQDLRGIAYHVLGAFVVHFASFGVSFAAASSIVRYFCERYAIEPDKVSNLLSELETSLREGTQTVLSDAELCAYKISKT